MASFAHRLTCLALAFVLSGTQAVTAVCMLLCLASPAAAADEAGSTPTHHHGHDAATSPAVVSPHAHHGCEPSTELGGAPAAPPDVRLVGSYDGCCSTGLVQLTTGPGEERTDAKAHSLAVAIETVSLRVNTAAGAVASPSPPDPLHSPGRSPLVLRI